MPSFHENFGNVVLESLFCGTPFLASDQVGVAEMLAGFAYGSALPLSAEGWANSLAHMLPTSYSSRVSLAASDMVRSKFSRLAVADSMLDLYAAVVAAVPS
jgi:glycosyltransferase involved in cell wall biosynthesis